MDTSILLTLTCSILFGCAFLRSALGFGDALLAVPLLGLLLNLPTASPIVALSGLTMSSAILVTDRRSIEFSSAWRLIVASVVGVPLGIYLVKASPEHVLRSVLGVLLVIYGGYNLIRPTLPRLQSEKFALPFGFIAGVLGGAYNTSGPPVVIYGTLRNWSPDRFRSTLQCYFIVTETAIITGHFLAGLWTPLVLQVYMWGLPAIGAGVYLGAIAHRRIPKEVFSRLVFFLICAIGVLFLATS